MSGIWLESLDLTKQLYDTMQLLALISTKRHAKTAHHVNHVSSLPFASPFIHLPVFQPIPNPSSSSPNQVADKASVAPVAVPRPLDLLLPCCPSEIAMCRLC